MDDDRILTDHLQFAPDILRRLGEELIPHAEQGILELVRNAYDADAGECVVKLRTQGDSRDLVVSDDGNGMDHAAITSGWLVLGKSGKAVGGRTAKGRLTVGDKGLGRLAALRMGDEARLVTRPATEPGVEYTLKLPWREFDQASVVEAVPLNVVQAATEDDHGTEITISNLSVPLGPEELNRLARGIILLSDPFQARQSFRPTLQIRGFAGLASRIRKGYFKRAVFRLVARLDDAGRASVELYDQRGKRIARASHADLRRRSRKVEDSTVTGDSTTGQNREEKAPASERPFYAAPAARFELWEFSLERRKFGATDVGALTEWLAHVGGVHVYHRGLRVYPYGDPGYDWLDMNLSRARSPEQRPSTNNSIGRVTVQDEGGQLLQKTDRTGFVENVAFQDLRRFARDALDWMARERVRLRDARRESERARAPTKVRAAAKSLQATIETVPANKREAIKKAVRRVERARDQEAKALRKEVQLYRTLSTVGTTVAVFAHQSAKPVSQIKKMISIIEARGREALGARYEEILARPIDLAHRSIDALLTFTALPIRLLRRDKREEVLVDVHEAINEADEWLKPFLENAQINLQLELAQQTPYVWGSVASVDAIVTNLITNSINAFQTKHHKVASRNLVVRSLISDGRVVLKVLDNGPGIRGIGLSDIWLPGETTTGGTGLGLTIVRDAVADLGGAVTASAHGELGGAEFTVDLPVQPAEK